MKRTKKRYTAAMAQADAQSEAGGRMWRAEHLIFEQDDAICYLCKNTGKVDVIPHGRSANDAREDECPWCIRRRLSKLLKALVS